MSAPFLATVLDEEMLVSRGVNISPGYTLDTALPVKTGAQVAVELGGRYLIRYVTRAQVGLFAGGSAGLHWVTPTPYSPTDTVKWLGLPAPLKPRTHALLLNPEKIPVILGPRRVHAAAGFEYLLPEGFPKLALAGPGGVGSWEIVVW
jgi:hypothetical protein